jgi:AcrR family transcriptional regulator
MPEFKTKKSENTYYRVLDTAIRMFAERGFDNTTMRAIGTEAKLGLGALYYYFPSKESIVTAFYEQLNQRVAREFGQQRPAEGELGELLRLVLKLKFEALEPHRDLARVLIKEAIDPDSALSPFSRDSSKALDISLELFQEIAGDPKVAKILWLGHLGIIAFWVNRPEKVEVAIDSFCSMAPMLGLITEFEPIEALMESLIDTKPEKD